MVSKETVLATMKANKAAIVTYRTEEDGIILTRAIYPMVLGVTRAGNLAIRILQYFGGTRSELGWKILRLDRIQEWQEKGMLPTTAPTGYRQNGDDDLKNIIYQVTYPLTETIDKPTSSAPSNEVSTGSILQPLLAWWRKWRNKDKKK